MERDELTAWLALLETPGVGRLGARRLLAAFGSPQAVLGASVQARAAVVSRTVADALAQRPAELAAIVERTARWLAGGEQHHILTLGDAAYPAAWLQLPDPALLVYAIGSLDGLQRPALAIVGTRHPTPEGREHAHAFGAALSAAGLSVVSGLAAGIDTAAHEGALSMAEVALPAAGHASTIAIVGTGLDRVYPRSNQALARRIAAHGLLLSEFPIGTAPLPANFPQRNRLIAGLSLGTLVVEAAIQSGSLITARLAVECGREVFAIPGSIHNPQSRGCHALIRQGAKLVESTQDVLEELHLAAPASPLTTRQPVSDPVTGKRDDAEATAPAAAPMHDDAEDPLLAALGWSAATLDVLQARTGWSASALNVRLLDLELAGEVVRMPGQLFARCARA
ncbi:MAG: DNA-processing protein DprA [Leptothrix sp. (in: b-proteobacteria)]